MKLKMKSGRTNLAATVFVPYDCKNNCKFCTSKKEYLCSKKSTTGSVVTFLKKISANPEIKDVVFTGGEPMYDIEVLSEMIEAVSNKNVFINTSLVEENFSEFVSLVNNTESIKAVNVSRHGTSFEVDNKFFDKIMPDDAVSLIKKPVKVNVVLDFDRFNTFAIDEAEWQGLVDELKEHTERWKNYPNVEISFRLDYRKITTASLHDMGCDIIELMSSMFEYEYHTSCDVCDSIYFNNGGQIVSLHRGLERSSIRFGNSIIINDIIMFPDGVIAYDWDKRVSPMLEKFIVGNPIPEKPKASTKNTVKTQPTQQKQQVVDKGMCGSFTSGSCGSSISNKPTKKQTYMGSCGGSYSSRC